MKLIKPFIILVLLTLLTTGTALSQNRTASKRDFDVLSQRVADSLTKSHPKPSTDRDSEVRKALAKMKEDGSFDGINYQDRNRTTWSPAAHMHHVREMAFACVDKNSSFYRQNELKGRIIKALQYWHDANPRSNNWWHNQISVPQTLGTILIVLKSADINIPEELNSKLIARMGSTGAKPQSQTGANKTDIAMHFLYRACLTNDTGLMKYSLDQLMSPIAYTMGEGLQYDNSYAQHGRQLYIGGYGCVLIDGITKAAMLTTGTAFELNGQKREIFSKFIRETYLRTIRGYMMSWNVSGRGITRPGNPVGASGSSPMLQRMAVIDPDHLKEYQDANLRMRRVKPPGYNLQPANNHYYRMDYMLHQRPAYTLDIRLASKRIFRNETGNGEGLKQYFLSDGGMCIHITGDEYACIFPVWDWARIPGVTCPHLADIPVGKAWHQPGTTDFAGGVSDGRYGIFAYGYNDRLFNINTSARKSWFLFDHEIVCLGSDIESQSGSPVNTTLNQCLIDGDVVVRTKRGVKKPGKGSHSFMDELVWVYHGNVGYYFPEGGRIGLESKTREGTWRSINNSYSDDLQQADVFTLWFDHGVRPNGGDYAYILVPGITSAEQVGKYPVDQINILQDKDGIHAVYHKGLDTLQLVFWEKGTFRKGKISVKAEQACLVMISGLTAATPRIYASDPLQTQKSLEIEVKTPRLSRQFTVDLNGPKHEKGISKKLL